MMNNRQERHSYRNITLLNDESFLGMHDCSLEKLGVLHADFRWT